MILESVYCSQKPDLGTKADGFGLVLSRGVMFFVRFGIFNSRFSPLGGKLRH